MLLSLSLTFPTPRFPVTNTRAAPPVVATRDASSPAEAPDSRARGAAAIASTTMLAISLMASLIMMRFVSLLAASCHSSTMRPTPILGWTFRGYRRLGTPSSLIWEKNPGRLTEGAEGGGEG